MWRSKQCLTVSCVFVVLALAMADGSPAAVETLWIRSDQATQVCGHLVFGEKIGLLEEGALGDWLVPAVSVSPDRPARRLPRFGYIPRGKVLPSGPAALPDAAGGIVRAGANGPTVAAKRRAAFSAAAAWG